MMVGEVLYVFGFSYLNNVYVASINWQLNLQSQVSTKREEGWRERYARVHTASEEAE